MATEKHTLLLGAHMSIAGGLEHAIFAGESIGCTAIQIFTHSNRQWHMKPLTEEAINLFKEAKTKSPLIKSVVVHASYLLNIGSHDKQIREKSQKALREELIRCEQLSIPYLIIHPGSSGTGDVTESINYIAEQLSKTFNEVPGKSKILLENMAGQGSAVAATFEQLEAIRQKSEHRSRIGICFDTCHAFAAGYNFSTEQHYEQLWQNFDDIIGLNNLHAIHINDSKKECGSRVDRHEHIGKGKIGLEAFRLLMNDPRFFGVPKILETPKEHDLKEDIENLEILKNFLTPKTKDILNVLKI